MSSIKYVNILFEFLIWIFYEVQILLLCEQIWSEVQTSPTIEYDCNLRENKVFMCDARYQLNDSIYY